jgi:predicted nuclease with TOPRIM domain
MGMGIKADLATRREYLQAKLDNAAQERSRLLDKLEEVEMEIEELQYEIDQRRPDEESTT